MTPHQKAIVTRTERLSNAFYKEYGRIPTIEELIILYSAEMAEMAARSNKPGQKSGFAKIDPQKALEIRRMGGYARKGTKNRPKDA